MVMSYQYSTMFILKATGISRLLAIAPNTYTLYLEETLKYLIQGITDPETIALEMREDGFEGLVKSCDCLGENSGCSSCYVSMMNMIDLTNFIETFQTGLILHPTMLPALSARAVQGGAYGVEVEILDPDSIAIHVF